MPTYGSGPTNQAGPTSDDAPTDEAAATGAGPVSLAKDAAPDTSPPAEPLPAEPLPAEPPPGATEVIARPAGTVQVEAPAPQDAASSAATTIMPAPGATIVPGATGGGTTDVIESAQTVQVPAAELPQPGPGPQPGTAQPGTAQPGAAQAAPTLVGVAPVRWPAPAAEPAPGGSGSGGPPDGPPPDRSGAPRRLVGPPQWVLLTIAGIAAAVLIAGIVIVLVALNRPKPAELVADSVTDAGTWSGAHYQGTVSGADGALDFDLDVTADGAQGTLTRNNGQARAEIVRDKTGTLIKANQQWWQRAYPAAAARLADGWVADPVAELVAVEPILRANPRVLMGTVNPNQPQGWRDAGELTVAGQAAKEITDGAHHLLIADAAPHRLLGIDILSGADQDKKPTRVSAVDAAKIGQINGAAGAARGATPPKSLSQRLLERPKLTVDIKPETPCRNPTCAATSVVVNSGDLVGTGTLQVSADDQVIGRHDFSIDPGQTLTFTDSVPNRAFSGAAGTSIQVLWKVEALPR
ncbi:hypothetical protein [Pseudonocardia sp. GCM10023141]|uniref:hypothetical protein n=1 Tax=Pseudonocardia sp. GCM10023141 TaxID=3252653 RepID=UPI0036067EB9